MPSASSGGTSIAYNDGNGGAGISAKGSTMALLRAMTLDIKSAFFYVRRTEKCVNRPGDTHSFRGLQVDVSVTESG
ncbi:hypothetical protein LMG28614_03229 [Paraburkholderia ultramafica]|uniref:Uncharacterized protein n=1 Tax=Paraburkholderia ultramafica TaxID=1544867 RepID=A0A6S7B8V7_9BURK|nr:hypothetical protein [Paraburkholderia ultramafica]CAB3791124.1 hypothetical protein LMG28614_03229 [Paraburkholderia ultramafica]